MCPKSCRRRLVSRARRAINHSIGAGIDADELTRFNNQSFCPELTKDPRLLRLATTPVVWSHVRTLLGDRRAVRPRACQIALRFPLPEAPHSRPGASPAKFTSRPLCAGFASGPATPTSHGTTAAARAARSGVCSMRGGHVRSLGFRMPKPLPVTGKAGGIVLAHYQVAHAVSPNLSGDIRYMCFFRLSVRGLASHRVESMLDIWRDWPELRALVDSG